MRDKTPPPGAKRPLHSLVHFSRFIMQRNILFTRWVETSGQNNHVIIRQRSVSVCVSQSVSVYTCVTILTPHISGVSEPIHTRFGVVTGWLGDTGQWCDRAEGRAVRARRAEICFLACNNSYTPYLRRLWTDSRQIWIGGRVGRDISCVGLGVRRFIWAVDHIGNMISIPYQCHIYQEDTTVSYSKLISIDIGLISWRYRYRIEYDDVGSLSDLCVGSYRQKWCRTISKRILI